MSEAKRTPVPWISGTLGTSVNDETIAYVRSVSSSPIEAMKGEPDICICCREANAEFIVRACNSHDELLAAAKDVLMEIGMAALDGQPVRPDDEALIALRAAISKAEGR